ncbi:MAG: hypothetical protein WEB03_15410 [Nitriliruptor sp.]|uniref:hypothetical protein n=1 Tax=Nitriliruptor sp. TaxID=2448056 RepID=UPI0034A01747
MAKQSDKRFAMSDEHKAALAEGRAQGRAVREYLAAIEADRKPGRKVDKGTVETKIADVQSSIDGEPDPAKRVELIQKRLDLEAKLIDLQDDVDLESLEQGFVDAAAPYSERKGITYAAWREAGVPAAVLKRAGVKRTRKAAEASARQPAGRTVG